MQYLVVGSDGPGFAGPEEAVEILKKSILPTFEALRKLEANGRIVAGGVPVASKTLIFIVEASSNDEVDRLVRDLPAWGVFDWEVTPLQSLEGRAAKDHEVLASLTG